MTLQTPPERPVAAPGAVPATPDARSRGKVFECIDGNEAAARVAYASARSSRSTRSRRPRRWASTPTTGRRPGRPNLWGQVPDVVEMQSEGGAAGALHGALQKGALATTFTASQGLLLMIPNMFKIAGELTPTVIHVAARTIATHALSIFGDHSDVMHARSTGWAMLAAGSVQEAHDFALVAHAATLRSRVPFLHFFDGFRTSHEINKIALIEDDDIRALVRDDDVLAFRARGMTPDAPVVRGTAQNPDVFFQAREAANPFYDAVPGIVEEVMDELARATGRRYGLGRLPRRARRRARRRAHGLRRRRGAGDGRRPERRRRAGRRARRCGSTGRSPPTRCCAALPGHRAAIAVLDRTKEPGAVGEPLYLDVVAALTERDGLRRAARSPRCRA